MQARDTANVSAMRPQDILSNMENWTEIGGVNVRKGTVAAFLQNAMRWSDPTTSDAARDALASELIAALPALRALGMFTVFGVRDERLRAMIDGQA